MIKDVRRCHHGRVFSNVAKYYFNRLMNIPRHLAIYGYNLNIYGYNKSKKPGELIAP